LDSLQVAILACEKQLRSGSAARIAEMVYIASGSTKYVNCLDAIAVLLMRESLDWLQTTICKEIISPHGA
jgi:hypothetical protein